MPLNKHQQNLVEENMGLVRAVIKNEVRNIDGIGLFTYQDIFQIGCLGLVKAAEKYAPGNAKFSTCAYTYIRNEIFSALDYASVRRRNEDTADRETILNIMPAADGLSTLPIGLDKMLDSAKTRKKGVVAKGIDAIRLMADGYTCREIGEMMGGVPANNITAWISKARAFLKKDPDVQAMRELL